MSELVQDGRLPFGRLLVARKGQLVLDQSAESELGNCSSDDAIFRFYSATKLFTNVAFAVLMDKYKVSLDEPLASYLGSAWDNQKVSLGGDQAVATESPITLRHCLTHTTGLTYGGMLGQNCLTDVAMDEKGVAFTSMMKPDWVDDWVRNVGSLAAHCDILATIPLKSQPGTCFEYSVSHLLVGRVIEVVSGMSLKNFMHEEVLKPLGCSSSCGWMPKDKSDLLPLYFFNPFVEKPALEAATEAVQVFGNLHVKDSFRDLDAAVFADAQMVGTSGDVLRLALMLTGKGKTADGEQLISPLTADLLMSNCLPGQKALMWPWKDGIRLQEAAPFSSALSDTGAVGFGLGGMVFLENAPSKLSCIAAAPGMYSWGGASCVMPYADPENELTIVLMSQELAWAAHSELWPLGQISEEIYEALLD